MDYDLVGIGNALVDIEVCVEDAFVQKTGLTKGGMTLFSQEDQKRVLDTLGDNPRKISSGGSAANTLHGFSVLGGSAYYFGRVASDSFGRHYSEDMKLCGVGFSGPGAEPHGTGTCLVLITPDSERTMLTHLGISSLLHPENVDETILRNAKMVYIEGYLWTGDETRAAATVLAQAAKKNGLPVALTLSDAFVVNTCKPALVDFIRWNVDILFCNEAEALAMVGTDCLDTAFQALQAMASMVFMTLGARGSWATANGEGKIVTDVFPVRPVDTTGAGDLFAAGVLYGLVRDYNLKEAAILGSYCAAQVITHMGARMPVHSHTRVSEILAVYRARKAE
jgi:sugar/nucleoside kinase (ribokinase family)